VFIAKFCAYFTYINPNCNCTGLNCTETELVVVFVGCFCCCIGILYCGSSSLHFYRPHSYLY